MYSSKSLDARHDGSEAWSYNSVAHADNAEKEKGQGVPGRIEHRN